MKLSDLDQKIAENYIDQITDPIRYGENAVLFWFPGSGMTTILRDIFNSKSLLQKSLRKLTSQIKVEQFFGHLSDKKNLNNFLNEAGYRDFAELKASCTKLVNEGYEVVYVLARIDDYPESEKLAILKTFLKLNSINPRRIHILFNTVDKPWLVASLNKYPELLVLANRMEIVPILKDKLINKYISSKAKDYGYEPSEDTVEKLIGTYGGVLQLTKEYLRSEGDTATLELKLRIVWNSLPKDYQETLKQQMSSSVKYKNEVIEDLKKFGVLDLKLFDEHKRVLDINPDKIIQTLLTPEELNLWNHCKSHKGEFIDKNVVINILRPEDNLNTSFWAIDQAISRFRKKLAKSGIDPETFKTLKGKGYICN